jgi:hypothetical protein
VKLTILFSGMIAADPHQGGATWAVLQYVLGFRDLGHEVYFIEPVPRKSLRPIGAALDTSVSADYFREVTRQFGLTDCSALLLQGTRDTVGLSYRDLENVAARADVYFNISGMLTDPALLSPVPSRVYLDLDPAFVQLWSAEYGIDMRFEGHNHFVTVGQQIGEAECNVPTCGLTWSKTFQPVVLADWPVNPTPPTRGFTTVGNWRAYGSAEANGVFYGQKAHSFRELIDLPTRSAEQFELALNIFPGDDVDRAELLNNHWTLSDPVTVAGYPDSYRAFVQSSTAELGVAKSGYVKSRCGWFSDRSVCYLASGRPVIAQETGFNRALPTGEGLFSFSTTDDALSAIESVRADYELQARQARKIAEEFFDSRKVLPRLLTEVGLS